MAQYTLATLATTVAASLRLSADTTRIAEIKSIIKEELITMWYAKPWRFARGRTEVELSAPKTAGTVSITSGGTTLTGVGTAWAATDVGAYVWLDTWNNPLEVVSYGTATSLTVRKYLGTTDLSAVAYRMYRDHVDLPTDFFAPRTGSEPSRKTDFFWVSEEVFKYKYPFPRTEGDPHTFAMTCEENTVLPCLMMHPVAATARLLPLIYHRKVTLPADDDDLSLPDLPEIFLLNQVLHIGWLRLKHDPKMSQYFGGIASEKYRQLIATYTNYQEQLIIEYAGMGRHVEDGVGGRVSYTQEDFATLRY